MAEYWREFSANARPISPSGVMRHRAGLSHLRGVRKRELLDHQHMEERIAAAPVGRHFGKSAYHAITYGWLLSGLARAVTGKGMRDLIRIEVAEPLNTDGIHLGCPPLGAPTTIAQIIHPQLNILNPSSTPSRQDRRAGGVGRLRVDVLPGMKAVVQGDIPLLDSELPSANGVATARPGPDVRSDRQRRRDRRSRYLSTELVAKLTGRRNMRPDRNLLVPLAFHLGYHGLGIPVCYPVSVTSASAGRSAGHPGGRAVVRLRAQPTADPFILTDQAGFVATAALVRRGAAAARRTGSGRSRSSGAPPLRRAAVGRRRRLGRGRCFDAPC